MSLALVTLPAQGVPNMPNCQSLINSAGNHISAAARITDIDDLRYFTMRDLQAVRTNLHLALELLELLKTTHQ